MGRQKQLQEAVKSNPAEQKALQAIMNATFLKSPPAHNMLNPDNVKRFISTIPSHARSIMQYAVIEDVDVSAVANLLEISANPKKGPSHKPHYMLSFRNGNGGGILVAAPSNTIQALRDKARGVGIASDGRGVSLV